MNHEKDVVNTSYGVATKGTQANAPAVEMQQPRKTLNPRDAAMIIYRRRWLVAALFLLIFITVAIATMLKPTEYVARAKVLLKKERAEQVISPGNEVNAAFKTNISEQTINTELELIQSASLLKNVALNVGVARLLGKAPEEVQENDEIALEMAISTIKRKLNVKPVPSSNLIEISYQSGDARLATDIVNFVCQFYVDRHLQVHENTGVYSFFQKQAEALYDTLQVTSEALRRFETSNGLVDPKVQREIILQQLSQYRAQLDEARIRSREAQELVKFLTNRLNKEPQRLQEQAVSVRTAIVESMAHELDSLEVAYKKLASPDEGTEEDINKRARLARSIRLRIAQIEKTMLAKEGNNNQNADDTIQQSLMDIATELTRAKSQLISNHIQESELTAAIARLEVALDNLENAKLTHQTLKRQWELIQDNYLLYAKKKEEARISGALDRDKVANVSIIDPATVPITPVPKNKKLSLVLGFFLALFVSVGAAFGLSYFDNTIRTSNDIERHLNIPVILVVSEGQWLEEGYPSESAIGALPNP